MKKRILCILLCLCLVSVLLPITAAADYAYSVIVGGVTLDGSKPYLANGASAAGADRPVSGGYAHFNALTHTLTLHDAVINGAVREADIYGIYSTIGLTVVLEGDSSITAGDAAFDDFFTDWRGDSKGIFADRAALTVSGEGSLIISSGIGSSSYGIYAASVTVKDGARVNISAGSADASSPGVSYSCGIYSGTGTVSVLGGADVTAAGGASLITEGNTGVNVRSFGVYAREINVCDADITATGNAYAMSAAPTVTGRTVTAATDVSGNDLTEYSAANIAAYKYIGVALRGAQAQWGVAGNDGSAPASWMQGDFSDAVVYANSLTGQTAYIKLLTDVNDAFMYIEDGKAVILDLAGKTLDRGLRGEAAQGEGHVIAINGGTLTLKDSVSGGKITGGNSLYGAGGGVTVRWGGTFYMEGGSITGNRASYGGGVFVAQNSLDGRDSLFCMSGGSITGNDSTVYGGGVRIAEYSAMKVSGAATIKDNFKGGTLSDGMYVLGSGEKSNVVLGGKAITVCGPLTGSIGIVKEDDYMTGGSVRIAESDASYSITASDARAFTSDSDDCLTAYSNNGSPSVLLQAACTVTYDANGATSGSVPTDNNRYGAGDAVTVSDNSGNLQKTRYIFVGWNTKADGTGTKYAAGSGTFGISGDTVLYAEWERDGGEIQPPPTGDSDAGLYMGLMLFALAGAAAAIAFCRKNGFRVK